MSKIRIYELAKELNVPSKKLVDALADLNLNVRNHMSTVDKVVADIIRDVLAPKADSTPQSTTDAPKQEENVQQDLKAQDASASAQPVSKKESDTKQMTVKTDATEQFHTEAAEPLEELLEMEEEFIPPSRGKEGERIKPRGRGKEARAKQNERRRRDRGHEQQESKSKQTQTRKVTLPRRIL